MGDYHCNLSHTSDIILINLNSNWPIIKEKRSGKIPHPINDVLFQEGFF